MSFKLGLVPDREKEVSVKVATNIKGGPKIEPYTTRVHQST